MVDAQQTPLVSAGRDALISIIDDDQSVREALQDLIDSLGFRVHAFPSAIEFLASTDIRTTSCMIADVHMPHMTGIELHRRLTELGHPIPTILITAYPNDGVRDRALADGVICYLTKPFDDNALIGCVQSALRSAKPGADA
jgi:FixJ family two-component response regulator